ncbi:MAG: 1-deoxy-D-xylulose-5-phosphate synthase, partial [Lachnospiraceae bacterium]|nr:1-deoxy-D-xylulose-5-phosphate synthase [Lachnospiraceae bacterium]
MYLEQIQKENDIKKIDAAHYDELAQEIRDFLIQKISVTGGHLGANLGCVELTMALHLALNLPEDKIIWDVGHQSYTHKLLTGRREGFDTLRTFGGMSGFPKRSESPCDPFNTGHSSTSISAGLGMVKARDLKGEKYSVVSVIGDGALTGGMAFEAINNAAKLNTNFIIVLNDNNMSISENVGGISKYLNGIRSAQGYLTFKEDIYHRLLDTKHGESLVQGIKHVKKNVKRMMVPGAYFEDLGLLYMGPVDGHDIITMRRMLTEAKKVNGPVLLHVLTHKGKGYAPAERHPARFHGAEPFDIETGLPSHPRTKASYTDIFSTVMLKMAARKKDVVAITAAMPDGVGLKRFRNVYPDRFFDVGIAEQHAVTFAAGLAAGGLHPVVAVYSSFLQRAYDQIIHDVCLQNLPVVFAVDRAGLVGSDGETHQGIFDLSYM